MRNLPHDISLTAVNPQVACEKKASPKYYPVSAESRGRPVGRSITPRAGARRKRETMASSWNVCGLFTSMPFLSWRVPSVTRK